MAPHRPVGHESNAPTRRSFSFIIALLQLVVSVGWLVGLLVNLFVRLLVRQANV